MAVSFFSNFNLSFTSFNIYSVNKVGNYFLENGIFLNVILSDTCMYLLHNYALKIHLTFRLLPQKLIRDPNRVLVRDSNSFYLPRILCIRHLGFSASLIGIICFLLKFIFVYFINCVYTTRKKIIFEFIIVYIVLCIVCAKINAVGLVLMHCQDHDLDPADQFLWYGCKGF